MRVVLLLFLLRECWRHRQDEAGPGSIILAVMVVFEGVELHML